MTTVKSTNNADAAAQAQAAVADAAKAISSAKSSGGPVGSGLASAVLAIVEFIEAINNLQRTASDMTSKLAKLTSWYSDMENIQLKRDSNIINAITPEQSKEDNGLALQQANNKFTSDQVQFNNAIATPQSLTSAYQSFVSNLSQATTSDYQNLGQLIQIWTNLAGILR